MINPSWLEIPMSRINFQGPKDALEPLNSTVFFLKKLKACCNIKLQGRVVQSIVSLKSSLVVKMLSARESTISNSQIFLLKKYVSSIAMQKL